MSDTRQTPGQQQVGQPAAPTGPNTPSGGSELKYGDKKIKVLRFLNVAPADRAGGEKAGKAAAKAMKLADAAAGEKWKAERPELAKYEEALKGISGAAAELKKVQDALVDADKIAARGAFVEARAFVKTRNLPAIVAQGLAEAKKLSAKALQAGKFKDAHDALTKFLEGSEAFLPPTQLADFSGRLAAIVDQVGSKQILAPAGVTQVTALQAQAQAAFAPARDAKAQVDQRLPAIAATLKALEATLPPALTAPYAEQRAAVETLVDEKEFVRAETTLTALEAQISHAVPPSLKQRWDTEYPAYITKVRKLGDLAGGEAQFAVASKELASAKAAADKGDYAGALGIIAAADLDQLTANAYAERSAGECEIKEAYPYLWEKVGELRRDLNTALNVDAVLTQDAWADLDDQLDAAIKPLFSKKPQGVDQALDSLRKALEVATDDAMQHRGALRKEQTVFDAKRQKMVSEDRLLSADNVSIVKERNYVDVLVGNAKYQDARTKLSKLSADLDAAGKEAANVAGYRNQAKTDLAKLQTLVTGIKQITDEVPGPLGWHAECQHSPNCRHRVGVT